MVSPRPPIEDSEGFAGRGQVGAAAVAHEHFQRGRAEHPGHPDPLVGQRAGVQDRVAEQFAEHQGGIGDGPAEQPGTAQVGGDTPRATATLDGAQGSRTTLAALTSLARPRLWPR